MRNIQEEQGYHLKDHYNSRKKVLRDESIKNSEDH